MNFAINKNITRWLLVPAIIFLISSAIIASFSVVFDRIYQNKIYPNIFIGSLNIGGQTAEQAKKLINEEINKISRTGMIFSHKNSRAPIMPIVSSSDGDIAIQIIFFNADQTVETALNYGRGHGFFINLEKKLSLLADKKQLALEISINQSQIEKMLKDNFPDAFQPAENAKLIVQIQPGGNYEFEVSGEKFGKIIDCEQAVQQMIGNLSHLDNQEIKLSTITQYPKISAQDALNIGSKAEAVLSSAPLALVYGDNEWIIGKDSLAGLLALKQNDSAAGEIGVGLDEMKTMDYLREKIAPEIDKKPIEAKFEINGGKVSEFQNGQDGQALDIEATFSKMNSEIANSGRIELIVAKQTVSSKAEDINTFGIKEIIGIGSSNFAGSPANRRHNIKIGAAAVNGSLIKPGEEFSLVKTLGEISSSTGYLPELVIKDNKTVPEFGGGLCQIGTTVFRATTESGLPVTMRRNHSYRVQYYEPAGTDATIYDPLPDYRFINDTQNYILIQSEISGDNLSFAFWGTKDGRVIEKTNPVIYNIVKPPPAKIIESLDLKPGIKKCSEKAHNGADAYFDYKVIYTDRQIKEKRFSSHYIPWQEVCLLGVEKLSEPEPKN
ncbi:MAG: VanW family protein [bacterium]